MIEAFLPALAGWRFFAALAVIGAVLATTFHAGRIFEGRSRDAAALEQSMAGARRAFAESEHRLKEAQNAQDHTDADKRRLAAARDDARSERERLRDQLDAIAAAKLAASDADDPQRVAADAAAARELFGACIGRYEGMAAEAGELAGSLAGLQRAIRASCPDSLGPGREGGRLDE